MKTFIVTKKENGTRLNRFVENVAPKLSGSLFHKYVRIKRIKVNGARTEAAYRLCEGDTVEMYVNDEYFEKIPPKYDFLTASRTLSVVYEDANIAILYKPAGILTHGDEGGEADTLINRYLRHLFESEAYDPSAENVFRPALCNRLDRGTFGLVIAAKNHAALSEMNTIIKQREVEKYYLCAVVGKPPNGLKKAYLLKDEKNNRVSISATPKNGYVEILTEFKTLKREDDLSLVEVRLHTGKTHQIRAHLAFLGFPVLGDGKYGNGVINRKFKITRQALCAYKLTFKLENKYPTLGYLDGKSFNCDDIWFRSMFK